ncbi:binding-protein-dependent transporters inner membrane component [Halorubrum coriense DSM 10284]|uniref:Binding-protein-dependent transporters inner membrane component n=1 Tax=Halorubrum coriense DSM 10284 TaxID=1227466 RepID=M0E846_9EURY|nr:binding-protein-dependent transporters inner membrane component [Halorubrum coriense DSM 10284]
MILPLTKPRLAVVLIFVWLAGWNELIIAQTLLRPENYPLSVKLYNVATEGRFSTPWTRFAAFANLFALPVAIVYFAAQRSVSRFSFSLLVPSSRLPRSPGTVRDQSSAVGVGGEPASRSRSWSALKSRSGPRAMIPVGVTSGCVV